LHHRRQALRGRKNNVHHVARAQMHD
jgi:hypothetical protein